MNGILLGAFRTVFKLMVNNRFLVLVKIHRTPCEFNESKTRKLPCTWVRLSRCPPFLVSPHHQDYFFCIGDSNLKLQNAMPLLGGSQHGITDKPTRKTCFDVFFSYLRWRFWDWIQSLYGEKPKVWVWMLGQEKAGT